MSKVRKFTPDEDASLLLAWHRGDMSAFETLVGKYHKRLFNVAFYLTGSDDSASAATQDAFIAAFATINSFSSRFHFSNWLLALTLKEARKLLDYRAPVLPVGASQHAGLHGQLTQLIRQLPPELAEVLVLHDVRGYSLERITEIYQLRTDVLVARLFAAHEMLAAEINKGGAPPEHSPVTGGEKIFPHPEIRRSFHSYLDSSLSAEDAEEIRKHLKSCGSCREALAGLEWIIEHLKELPDFDPPHWLPAAIMQRVQNSAVKPENVHKAQPALFLQLGAGFLLVAVIGLSAYLLLHENDGFLRAVSGKETARIPDNPSLQPRQQSKAAGFITSMTAPFTSPGRPVAPAAPEGSATQPSVPLAQPVPPAETAAVPAPPPSITPVAAPVKSDVASRRDRRENSPELPSEWGESPAVRPQQQKAAAVRSRSSELAVEMITEDPVAAIREVETAVASLGGSITGRAYSSGSDILYTRIDVDRFFALMNRLGKVGRIQELPQPPDGTEGVVDLIIRWH
jgi:DNA-directed RNA polymerase specialized sigma24 family protein